MFFIRGQCKHFGKNQMFDDNCWFAAPGASIVLLIGVLLWPTKWQILKIVSVNCFSSKGDLTVKPVNSLFAT